MKSNNIPDIINLQFKNNNIAIKFTTHKKHLPWDKNYTYTLVELIAFNGYDLSLSDKGNGIVIYSVTEDSLQLVPHRELTNNMKPIDENILYFNNNDKIKVDDSKHDQISIFSHKDKIHIKINKDNILISSYTKRSLNFKLNIPKKERK